MARVPLDTATTQPIAIGSIVWMFDSNHRIYRKKAKGNDYSVTGAPVWRRYWRRRRIESETSRSWVTNIGEKIPKKGPRPGWAFSEQEIDDLQWVEEHIYPITEWIRRAGNNRDLSPEKLREIARIAGYAPRTLRNEEGLAWCATCDGVGWTEQDIEFGRRQACAACKGTGFQA